MQRAVAQETQAVWRARHPEYAIAQRITQRSQDPRGPPPRVPSPLTRLPWDLAKDEIRATCWIAPENPEHFLARGDPPATLEAERSGAPPAAGDPASPMLSHGRATRRGLARSRSRAGDFYDGVRRKRGGLQRALVHGTWVPALRGRRLQPCPRQLEDLPGRRREQRRDDELPRHPNRRRRVQRSADLDRIAADGRAGRYALADGRIRGTDCPGATREHGGDHLGRHGCRCDGAVRFHSLLRGRDQRGGVRDVLLSFRGHERSVGRAAGRGHRDRGLASVEVLMPCSAT